MSQAQPPKDNASSVEELKAVSSKLGHLDRLERLLTDLELRAGLLRSPDASDGEDDEEDAQKTVSKVKDCDWEHFINRFDPTEPVCSIEALVAGTKLRQDIAAEASKRAPKHIGTKLTARVPLSRVHRLGSNSKWIHAVRIQSAPLLAVFGRVTGYDWGTQPHTFVRPFPDLIYYHEKLKDELRNLECSEKPARDSQAAIQDLRCYIDFAERRLLPDYTRIREATELNRLRVRFSDLWYLFKPGDMVYVPSKTLLRFATEEVKRERAQMLAQLRESPWHQRVWRLLVAKIPSAEAPLRLPAPPRDNENPEEDDGRRGKELPFRIVCYYLDYDGKAYGAVERSFRIEHYEGEKDIRELEVYPLRFADDPEDLLQAAKESGRLFTDAIPLKHMMCESWTCDTDPSGFPVQLQGRNLIGIGPPRAGGTEYVEGEVIIDLKETYNTNPIYQNAMANRHLIEDAYPSSTLNSGYRVIMWSDSRRSKRIKSIQDSIRTSEEIEEHQIATELKRVPYLRASTRPQQPPQGDDLALLTVRIFVYAFRLRKFLPVDVRNLKPLAAERGDPFEDLQLPENYKKMIQATVETHLKRQDIQRQIQSRRETEDILTQDFIAGKGRGLLVMLHGEPGVGKTATAEAIARSTKRPLFPISCNDLITPNVGAVELALDDAFRLAHMWDCVLLMDEADVFLASRSTSMIHQNSLVSMFLRKLEYYSGILFLTSNRIGKVDQAISSRIHLILHYKRLGLPAIVKIFDINIRNLEEVERQHHEASGQTPLYIVRPDIEQFAIDHYNKHPNGKGVWNGRQIRNAFLVAASLARHEASQPGMEGRQPQLRDTHFHEVERLTREYNQFRFRVLGGDDSRKAKLLEERDDDYEGEEDKENDSARPGASPSPTPTGGYQSPHGRVPQRPQHTVGVAPGPPQWSPVPTAPRIQVGVHPDWAINHAQAGYAGTVIRPAPQTQSPSWQAVGPVSSNIYPGQISNQPPPGYANGYLGDRTGQVTFVPLGAGAGAGQDMQAGKVPGPGTPESQVGHISSPPHSFASTGGHVVNGEVRT
ncbi:hypothetical protein B0T16DRAFT_170904 [Cercophora newfieldiana]|uniref:AAA+ ATPase domain-containing protein n=1 Tax=Cercophora newfieldiana TaxID=92897 RepID=A0AA39Y6F3_9PEZI|nr:hypothetical protein B0T16DRAFT_170904 [Cercophora newfieldiana]